MTPEIKKEIVELFKNEGLELAEDMAEMTIRATFKILPLLAAKTTNTMDDMIILAIGPVLERELLKLADNISDAE